MVKIEHDFTVEYAKSNKSACKGCKDNIAKDALRIGKMVQAQNFDGKIPLWHHFDCFFAAGNQGLTDAAMLHNKDNIKFADLQKIIDKMGSGAPAPPVQEKCGGCKADVQPQWKACPMCGESLEKKRKAEADANGSPKKQKLTKEQEKMRDQNDLLFQYSDSLKNNFETSELKALLEHNDLPVSGGPQNVLRRCAESLLFGVLPKCPECNNGNLHVDNGIYKCTAYASEWARCMYETDKVKTTPFKIPKKPKLFSTNEWLKGLDLKPRERILIHEEIKKKEVTADDILSGAVTAAEVGKDRPYYKIGNASKKPLEGCNIALSGKFDVSLPEMKKMITKLGGTVSDKVQVGVTHLVCKTTEWEANKKKTNSKCEQAKSLDIPVLKPDWIEEAESKGAIVDELKFLIGGSKAAKKKVEVLWGAPSADAKPEEEKKVKLVMKGRAAVDPVAGEIYVADYHVLDEGKDLYNVVLNVTDITTGQNSYYGLQVLETDKKNGWALFRKWGRVGTKIGDSKVEEYKKKDMAIKQFLKLYEEKTGNDWSNRNHFEKKPGKFYPIDIDYGQDEDKKVKKRINHDARSKLDPRLQDFVSLVFDIKLMEAALKEMEIDLTKMPLGKLSKGHIEDGMRVLKQLGDLIDSPAGKASKKAQFLGLTNQFYTKIPHDFGTEQGPVIDNTELLKEKVDLMNALIEMEIAANVLKGVDEAGGESVIDQEYTKLKTQLTPLDKDDEEYQMAVKYCQNQQGRFKLVVKDIFKCEREGEADRFANSKEAHHNRKLLWHGSPVTNYVGILSQGLRIAPPEAPKSGYRFGKGVYFADLCEKSAGYCRAAGTDALVMMLCEVALGDEKELLKDQYMEKALPGSHSTHAMGGQAPDPKQTITLSDKKRYGNLAGVEVPLGKPVKTNIKSSCTHNEFIVYSTEQVRIRYVLRLAFA